jgi:hypothetical protein
MRRDKKQPLSISILSISSMKTKLFRKTSKAIMESSLRQLLKRRDWKRGIIRWNEI